VDVCSAGGASLAGASRHARADHPVTPPSSDPEASADEIAGAASDAGADAVLPATEASMLALLPRRRELERAVIPFGDVDAFRALSDKDRVHELAGDVGLAVPEQEVLASPGELGAVDLGWPVVIKPSRSVREAGGGLSKQGVGYATSPEELSGSLSGLPPSAYPVLLQRRIEGRGTGVFLLRWNDRIYARFAHRRLREKPPSGGVSVYRESVVPPSGLFASSERLLEMFDWRGVAMVEYRVEPEGGTPYLMEINGRLWGSLQLAIDSGVDFPDMLVRLALGEDVRPVTDYRTGVRCRWWWGNVDHVWLSVRERCERADDGRRTAGEGIGSLLCPWLPGDRFEVLRLSDPRPFMRETRGWLEAATTGHSRTSS
jgi:predicted ATP-grasp superfamily ATP-dependent carboligase